jgi:ATP-dependent exoDNAse (exonuclease V) beta subunit
MQQFTRRDSEVTLPKLKDKTINGKRYYFDPDKPEVKWPSITTVLSAKEKPALVAWKKRVGAAQAKEIAKKASIRGNSLHWMIEHYLKNEDPATFKEQKSQHKIVFNQTRSLLDRKINNIFVQEQKMYSKTLKVAGRCDVIAEWDKVLSVIDFKSSNRRRKEEWNEDYYIQSSFYAFAFWELTRLLPKQIVIVVSADDFTVVPYVQKASKFLPKLEERVKLWYKVNRA